MISRTALRSRLHLPPLRAITTRLSSTYPPGPGPSPAPAASTTTPHGGGESAVYSESQKFPRPATVTWSERLNNWVSFIGRVEYPVKQSATKDGRFGVHTLLRVQSSPRSQYSFRILVGMWDELAKRALAHLKPNDHIYVAGQLGSYTKSTVEGTERLYYKVTASELNYVQVLEQNFQPFAKAGLGTCESNEEKHRNRLLLWQLLFSNPDEWFDCRAAKKSPRHPDFRHKSTGEALWLRTDDPPWVKKQLDLLGNRHASKPRHDPLSVPLTSNWLPDA